MQGDDNSRYIEYFQKSLIKEGSERFLSDQQKWFERNRISISEKFLSFDRGNDGSTRKIATAVLNHKDQGDYDNFFARQIFEPLVEKVLKICVDGGFAPKLPVRFANSPDVAPSPAALPSTVEHIIFAGQGTFAFCNYWSKIFSTAIAEVSLMPRKARRSPKAVIAKLRQGTVLHDAARLAVRYATTESIVGFGKLEQPVDIQQLRVILLNAMEVFVIAHEIAHFIAHERFPESNGIAPGSSSKQLELECDMVGFSVCTAYGAQENNPFAFQLIGPLLLFYALRICDKTEAILTGCNASNSDSHPAHEERIRFALDFLTAVGASKQVKSSAKKALEIAMIVGTQVQLLVEEACGSEIIAGES